MKEDDGRKSPVVAGETLDFERDAVDQNRVHGADVRGASIARMSQAFGLVIVGDEILSGKRVDKHMPKVIELLGARGLQLAWAEYVGDEPDRIVATPKRAFASGDVVFSCGG